MPDLDAQEDAQEIEEQQRLLTDPALSFETPTPTPEDQMREAAAAGLTTASAREVWEQTRSLIMTEQLDAVSRDDLLDLLGPAPSEDETILLDGSGQVVEALDAKEAMKAGQEKETDLDLYDEIEVVDESLWLKSDDGSEYRIVIGQSSDGFRWAIDDGDRESGGDLSSISWSGKPVEDRDLALGQGMRAAREFYELPRNDSRAVEREDEGLAL